MSPLNLLGYTARISLLIPIVLLLFNQKKNRGRGLWVIFLYLCYSVVTEIVNSYYNQVIKRVSYFNFNLFTIVEYILLAYFIFRIVKSKNLKMVMLAVSGVFVVMATVRLFMLGPGTYDSMSSGVQSILLIVYSIFYLFEQISKPDHIFFYSVPEFWIVVAILLYFSGTFFLVGVAQILLSDAILQDQYKLIVFTFETLKNILLAVAVLVKGEDKKNTFTRIDYSSLDEHLNLNR